METAYDNQTKQNMAILLWAVDFLLLANEQNRH